MSLQRSGQPALPQAPPAESLGGPAHQATQAAGLEQPYFRLDIRRALELHRTLALGFAIAGMVLAVAYTALTWPRYTAESQIYIQPTSAKIMDAGNNAQRWPYDSNSYDSFIEQQVQLASNPEVLVNAMDKLPAGSWQRAGESDQAAAERLGGVLKVERLGSSYQVSITAHARSAQMAADIANAVANSIVEKAAHEANAGDSERLAILQAERDRVQNQLNADLSEQNALNQQLGMAAVGTEAPDLIDNAIGATREELIKARTDHDEAEARFAAMGSGTSSAALDAEADQLVASDPGLTSMKTSLNQRRATLITQMANLTPNNPEYKLDSEELNKINTSLDAMMKDLRAKAAATIQERLRTDLERTSGVEAQLNGQLRQLAATAASATPKLQRANDLATDIVRLRTRYAAVDEELHDIMLQDSVPGAVHLSVAAVPPLHPSFSGILRRSVPLALGGILLGLLAALLANHLDQRVYIASDMEHLLGFAPMAALPDFDEVPEAVFEEHILRLSTAIEHARKQGSLRTCIFTGTGAGAGVSTIVTRVRDMLASMGRPTVLVNATGTVATGTAQAASRANAQPVEEATDKSGTLSSERGTRSLALLRRVTEESGTQDESLVLADTAPLLISAETEYLARFVDCAIVVVESGKTTHAELRATVDSLQRLNVSTMGVVLNRVGLAKADTTFRNSMRGMESHIRLQGRADQWPAPRPHHFAEETPAVSVAQETPQAVVHRQPVVARPVQASYQQAPVEPARPVAPPVHPKAETARPKAETAQPEAETAQPEAETLVQPVAAPLRTVQLLAEREAEDQRRVEYLRARQMEAGRVAAEQAAMERLLAEREAADRAAAERAAMQRIAPEQIEPAHQAEPVAPQFVSQGHIAVEPPSANAAIAPVRKEPSAQEPTAPEPIAQESAAPAPTVPVAGRDAPWWLSETPLATPAKDSIPAPGVRVAGPVSGPSLRPGGSRISGLRGKLFGTGSGRMTRRQQEEQERIAQQQMPSAHQPQQPEPAQFEPGRTPSPGPQPAAPQRLEPAASDPLSFVSRPFESEPSVPAFVRAAEFSPVPAPVPEPIPIPRSWHDRSARLCA